MRSELRRVTGSLPILAGEWGWSTCTNATGAPTRCVGGATADANPVADQAVAGALAWSYGEPVALLTTVIFAIRWRRDEESETAKREADVEREDAELAAYNAFLRGLHQQPRRPTDLPSTADKDD